MCGIVGVTGAEDALPILMEGLARLEYRGYDSAGVALQSGGRLWVRRKAGKLAELAAALDDAPRETASGIGHTRWATHGAPEDRNAHPHTDCSGGLAVVHNGIIENHAELRAELMANGHVLASDTDTEVLAHLIEAHLAGEDAGLADALRATVAALEGAFSVAAVHTSEPDLIVAARRVSPLIVGRTDAAGFLASDIPAILGQTRELYALDDDQLAEIRPGSIRVTTLAGAAVTPRALEVTWSLEEAEKGGFDDFMLKEIHEQPKAVLDTLVGRLHHGALRLDQSNLSDSELRKVDKVFVVGCGTSYYAGLAAKYAIEHWAHLPVEIDISSEFRYRDPVLDSNTLVVGVSQSGETVDTMQAIRHAREGKAKVLVITNVVDSSMAREADAVLYTRAGPEIGVAATKTHLAQLVVMQVLALYLAQLRGTLYPDEIAGLVEELDQLPARIETVLATDAEVQNAARRCAGARDFFFLGRHVG
ncbi:MAG TPA: glutamine--fructose-6-phosphate transaminase (isomerizing), partial [Acidimicrobiales bacterium]|nr:glutamine--fructose-6-phosphate transaminase (isomerizing) [Acidimicrobiales bacterium]